MVSSNAIKSAALIATGLFMGTVASAQCDDPEPARGEPTRANTRAKASGVERARSVAPLATRVVDGRLRALEHKLATLAPREHDAESGIEARRDAAHSYRERLEHRLERHAAAPVDPEWADQANTALEQGIVSLVRDRDDPVELTSLDCRESSCMATLSFPSYGDALSGYAAYVTTPYELNCATTASLDDPDDPTRPYTVAVLFHDCVN